MNALCGGSGWEEPRQAGARALLPQVRAHNYFHLLLGKGVVSLYVFCLLKVISFLLMSPLGKVSVTTMRIHFSVFPFQKPITSIIGFFGAHEMHLSISIILGLLFWGGGLPSILLKSDFGDLF